MFTKPSQDILMHSANVDPSNPLADIDRQKPISIMFVKIASQAKQHESKQQQCVQLSTSYYIHTVLHTRLLLNTRIRTLMFTKPPQDILILFANVDPLNLLADIVRQKPISIIFIKIALQAKQHESKQQQCVRLSTKFSIHTVLYTRLLLNTRIRSLMFTKPS